MASVIGSQTINQSRILELDASPLAAPTPGVLIGDICIVDGVTGIWQKTGTGDSDFVRIDAWTAFASQAAAAGTLTLTADSDGVLVFTGATAGQVVQLPDATTLINGFTYYLFNDCTQPISIKNSASTTILAVPIGARATILLANNSSAVGSWTFAVTYALGAVPAHAPTHISTGTDPISVATQAVTGLMSTSDKIKIDTLSLKAGIVTAGSFSGNPKKYTVTFTTPFADNNYAVAFSGGEGRVIIPESKASTGFDINTQANQSLVGIVSWTVIYQGEVV